MKILLTTIWETVSQIFKILKSLILMFLVIADCGGLLGLFLGFSFTAAIRFIRQLIESFKARETKVKDFDLKASKVSWVNDVDDRDDFMTLLWWQLQARKRANLHGFKKRNKLFKRSARVK